MPIWCRRFLSSLTVIRSGPDVFLQRIKIPMKIHHYGPLVLLLSFALIQQLESRGGCTCA